MIVSEDAGTTAGVVLAFLCALALSLIFTPVCEWAGLRLGVLDFPEARKVHKRPTPLLGGIAVFVAFAGSTAFFVHPGRPSQMFLLLAGAATFGLIGLIDDLFDAGPWKLGAEAAIVIAVVWLGGIRVHLPWPYMGDILAVCWLVGVANAVNCFDCVDGVAAGTVAITAVLIIPLALFWGRSGVAVAAAALAGASLGFLKYNFSPARLFLGDAGSLMLGFLVAALPATLIPSREHHAALVTWIAPILLLAAPVGDFLLVHVRRYMNGVRHPLQLLAITGKDHLPHRLLDTGRSPRDVALWLFGLTALTGLSGVCLVIFGPFVAVVPCIFIVRTLLSMRGQGRYAWTPTRPL